MLYASCRFLTCMFHNWFLCTCLGPKKGSGGRPTLTSKFKDLKKQFEELKRSLAEKKKKNHPIKAPNMGFKIPKILKDRPTQDPFPKLLKIETKTTKQPHDPTVPNPIKTKTSKMPLPPIPNHPPVQALKSRKISRHPEENTEPLDIFQEEDPALKPILIICDLFIMENMVWLCLSEITKVWALLIALVDS